MANALVSLTTTVEGLLSVLPSVTVKKNSDSLKFESVRHVTHEGVMAHKE